MTSGFQPLWQFIVSITVLPFEIIGQSRWAAHGVLLINLLVVLINAAIIFSLLEQRQHSPLTNAAAVGSAVAVSTPFLLNGMESAVLVGAVALFAREYMFGKTSTTRLALLAALVVLARYDAIVLILVWLLMLLPRLGVRRLARILLGPAFVFASIGSALTLADGDPIPISAEVKQFWADAETYQLEARDSPVLFSGQTVDIRTRRTLLALDREGETVVNGTLFGADAPLSGRWYFALGLTAILAFVGFFGRRSPHRQVLVAITISSVAQIAYYGVLGFMFWRWYLVLPVLAINLVLFSTGFYLLSKITMAKRAWTVTVAGVVVVALATTAWTRYQRDRTDQGYGDLYSAAVSLVQEVDPSATIGSWAAGQIGFLHTGPTVNLEGLVGNQDLLRANGDFDLGRVLADRGITWLLQGFPFPHHDPERCRQDWHRYSIGWHLRMKLLIDHPSAFTTLVTLNGDNTAMSVINVNQAELVTSLNTREERRASRRLNDLVLPAEDFIYGEDTRASLVWPDAEGWALSASELVYILPDGEPTRTVRVRALSTLNRGVDLGLKTGEVAALGRVEGDCTWRVVDFGPIPFDDEATLRLQIPSGVYVDEIYVSSN